MYITDCHKRILWFTGFTYLRMTPLITRCCLLLYVRYWELKNSEVLFQITRKFSNVVLDLCGALLNIFDGALYTRMFSLIQIWCIFQFCELSWNQIKFQNVCYLIAPEKLMGKFARFAILVMTFITYFYYIRKVYFFHFVNIYFCH
jgi:hypothetical protein